MLFVLNPANKSILFFEKKFGCWHAPASPLLKVLKRYGSKNEKNSGSSLFYTQLIIFSKGHVLFCRLARADKAKVLLSISASRQFKIYIYAWFYSAEILIIVTVKRCDSKNAKKIRFYTLVLS